MPFTTSGQAWSRDALIKIWSSPSDLFIGAPEPGIVLRSLAINNYTSLTHYKTCIDVSLGFAADWGHIYRSLYTVFTNPVRVMAQYGHHAVQAEEAICSSWNFNANTGSLDLTFTVTDQLESVPATDRWTSSLMPSWASRELTGNATAAYRTVDPKPMAITPRRLKRTKRAI